MVKDKGKDKHTASDNPGGKAASKRKKSVMASGSKAATRAPPQPALLPVLQPDIERRLTAEKAVAFRNEPDNRHFFRDQTAWDTYNTKARIKAVSKVYYYDLPEPTKISS